MPNVRLLFLLAFLPCAVSATHEVSIREFAAAVHARVVAKVTEALEGDAAEKASVVGIVTYIDKEHLFLQRDDDGLKVKTGSPANRLALRPGDTVEICGSPSIEGGRVILKADTIEKRGVEELPEARYATVDDLVYAGCERKGINWLRVTIDGRVLGPVEGGFAIDVEGVPANVHCQPLPDSLTDAAQTHPVVRVTGVVELLLDQSEFLGRDSYVMGVKLNANDTDVELLPDYAYLSARRARLIVRIAAVVCAILATLLIAFIVQLIRQRRRLFRSRTLMAERKRMADDLHDTIEQHLVGAGMMIKIGRLKEAEGVLVRAKREIRDIVWGLKNDDMMRLSPAEMLRQLAHDENTKGLCRVDTKLTGLPTQMNAAQMRDLSLIVREAIGNAIKHGGAKKIAISADAASSSKWRLRVANDGIPFDPATVPGATEGHFGLEGMRQRARRLGAEISFVHRGKWTILAVQQTKESRPDREIT